MTCVAVVGAGGRTGRLVVEAAVDQGFQVRALARTAQPYARRAAVETVTGDVFDGTGVDEVVAGADLVISAFGHVRNSPPTLQTTGTARIVSAMQAHGVNRIVSLSGIGLSSPDDHPGRLQRLSPALFRLVACTILTDAARHVDVLTSSSTEWTVVRAPRLVDGPGGGDVLSGFLGDPLGSTIARTDLAGFLLDEAVECRFPQQLPAVAARPPHKRSPR